MSNRSSSTFDVLSASLSRCAAVVTALASAWERRRVVGQLGALDDHMLADIGITRQDVHSVLAEPMYRDPSLALAERAQESRRASRSALRLSRTFGSLPSVDDGAPASASYSSEPRRAA